MWQRAFLITALGPLLAPTGAHAGAWTLPQGQLWAKVSYFQQTTDEWYINSPEPFLLPDNTFSEFPAGTRRPYRFDGEYDSKALFIEAFYGVTDRLDVGVQVPYFDQVFDDDTRSVPPSDAGFSDLRAFAKWRLAEAPVVLSLQAGVKVPTGDFKNEDGLIPVGEGQWDFDFVIMAGRSFWPVRAYANVDLGYRVRLENEDILREPGDEWLLNAEVGYTPWRSLLIAVKLESLRGRPGKSFGFKDRSQTKRITYVSPSLSYTLFGSTAVEAAVRVSTGGRNFPAGHQLTLGLSTRFDPLRLAGVR